MNKRNFLLLGIGLMIVMLSTEVSYAQLLEDRNKLKTAKSKRQGFSPFKKHIKKSSGKGKPSVAKAPKTRTSTNMAGSNKPTRINPKYSQPSRSKSKYSVHPRYSQNNAGQAGHKTKVSPRYSQSNPGRSGRVTKVSPRFSQNNAGQAGHKVNVNPRFSQAQPGRSGKKQKINPRYSQEMAGQVGHKWKVNPRFSQAEPGRSGKKTKISPRFSQENAGQVGHKWNVNPRFTQDKAGSYPQKKQESPRFTQENAGQVGHKWNVNPRFSQTNAGQFGEDKKIKPRFSKENAGEMGHHSRVRPRYTRNNAGDVGVHKVRPRYSIPPSYVKDPASNYKIGFLSSINVMIDKAKYKKQFEQDYEGPKVTPVPTRSQNIAKHNQNIRSYQKYSNRTLRESPNYQIANYTVKVKHQKKPDDLHPSARYLSAKNDSNHTVRESKRKINVAWVRMFGNQTQPDAVKDKVNKAKFDKDEKDIWNN
ncbi:hypothetical protein BFP72_00805 [Reichenbachiella sp. 5M10]|uniref:hypothetical protein n=1 Tax=Reichenbachiella sp. 5M10 TaxID=1889772 RepID=UPI000C14DD26|nr:hypothetical protein [Reichenbachiella sp. 5M10]PIB34069.1 hypothetical protein BFP72_00805 [Reichenbachiella sp. 5M10]